MITSILPEIISGCFPGNPTRHQPSFLIKANILCSPQELPDGSQILHACLFLKSYPANGVLPEIHAVVRRKKIKLPLVRKAPIFLLFRVKRMHSSIWATDGLRIILPTAGISGYQLNGKKEIRLLNGTLTGTWVILNNNSIFNAFVTFLNT